MNALAVKPATEPHKNFSKILISCIFVCPRNRLNDSYDIRRMPVSGEILITFIKLPRHNDRIPPSLTIELNVVRIVILPCVSRP